MVMTIEEKAKKEYPCINSSDYPETCSYNKTARNGFIKGAEWMIVKATAWLVKQGLKTNEGVVTICVKDFIKAMEE